MESSSDLAVATEVKNNEVPSVVATEVKTDEAQSAVATEVPTEKRIKEVYDIICGTLNGNDIRAVINELKTRGLVDLLKTRLNKKNKVVRMDLNNNTSLSLIVDTTRLNLDGLQDADYWEVVPGKKYTSPTGGGRKSKKQRKHQRKHQRKSRK
jgi:hypothetical protein